MSKILLLTLDFPPRTGGVARYLGALADFFHEKILVVTEPEPESEKFDFQANYPIERRKILFCFFWPGWFKAVWLLIRKKQIYRKVIVSHLLPLGSAAWLAGIFTGKPYLVIVHGLDVAAAGLLKRKKWLAGQVLRRAEAVITNSKALAEEVERSFGVKKTVVVYPGIKKGFPQNRGDRCDFKETTFHQKLSDRRVFGETKFILLTVSRLVSRKGHLRVLRALVKIKEQIPNLQYRIIGDGPIREELQKNVFDLGLSALVKFEGFLSDTELAEAYDQADVFVMPTVIDSVDREGFGIVYLEAAAHGLPSIATKQPGVDEAVLDNQTGLLIPDGDIDALSEAVLRLWRDSEARDRLGAAAQKRILEEFVWEKQMGKLERYL